MIDRMWMQKGCEFASQPFCVRVRLSRVFRGRGSRPCQRDLVEDKVVADGADELAHALAFLRKGVGEVVDRAGGFDRVPACTDVLHRIVVRHGAEGDVWIRGKLDDLLVVLQCGEVDAMLLRCIVEVYNAHMWQPVRHRRECDLALLAHHALEFFP